jgi:hypothetical protein
VAVDVSPILTITDPQCFHGNQPDGTQRSQEQNYRKEATWVLWDAAGARQYLDMGTNAFTLADSPTIAVNELIEGSQNVFSATRQVQTRGDIVELEVTNVVTALSDLSATPTGSIQLSSTYSCESGRGSCPSEPAKRSCSISLSFWARRLDAQQNAGAGISAATP